MADFAPQSSDRVPIAANTSHPTRLMKNNTTITTSTTDGSYVKGSVTIPQIGSNPLGATNGFYIYGVTPGKSVFPIPGYTRSGGNFDLVADLTITRTGGVNTAVVTIKKRGGATTDVYKVYWILDTQYHKITLT